MATPQAALPYSTIPTVEPSPSINQSVGESTPLISKKPAKSTPASSVNLTFVYLLLGLLVAIGSAAVVLIELDRDGNRVTAENFNMLTSLTEYKFALRSIPPRLFQVDRGTCWDFATIGVLEADYRSHGIEKGFLQPNEYVQFSEQAYGISVMRECERTGQANCREWGDNVSNNSTEGGELGWLYYMPNLFNQVLPVSVCPYPPTSGHEEEHCPGMDEALATNPVKFNLTGMTTVYEPEATKRLLRAANRALGWSSLTHMASFHLPCEGPGRSGTSAPPSAASAGEFYTHGEYILEGGHGMLLVEVRHYNPGLPGLPPRPPFPGLPRPPSPASFPGLPPRPPSPASPASPPRVLLKQHLTATSCRRPARTCLGGRWSPAGYNDQYRTKLGQVGGHTIAYFMGELSDWDERTICPNAHNPRSWLSCVNVDMGPTHAIGTRHRLAAATARRAHSSGSASNDDIDLTMCLNDKAVAEAVELTRQPLEFACQDAAWGCRQDARYFLYATADGPDDTVVMTMVEYDPATQNRTLVALAPMPWDMVAEVYQPVAPQMNALKNNDLLCGFYFFPYDSLSTSIAKFPGSYYSTHFEIEWDDQSYAFYSARNPTRDYTLLRQSTGIQPTLNFTGPYPFNHRL
ncbi:putative hect e3 ubiquitin [Paratrimastix pyriformis]|uniref:Hect e3 ubiquitin n=1 Tax=Paratrimastix pyriformis TaxID=342808 RepID=A0ABQ8UT78_9EUKA|nr:putative hect e3 ubiquitin [Paratrimastix pyriformis]